MKIFFLFLCLTEKKPATCCDHANNDYPLSKAEALLVMLYTDESLHGESVHGWFGVHFHLSNELSHHLLDGLARNFGSREKMTCIECLCCLKQKKQMTVSH